MIFVHKVVTTKGLVLNHDKSLQIYFFCVKRQAKNDFLKDVESTVDCRPFFTRETTFVTSCLLYCTTNPFRKEVYSKRKEFAPLSLLSKERI